MYFFSESVFTVVLGKVRCSCSSRSSSLAVSLHPDNDRRRDSIGIHQYSRLIAYRGKLADYSLS